MVRCFIFGPAGLSSSGNPVVWRVLHYYEISHPTRLSADGIDRRCGGWRLGAAGILGCRLASRLPDVLWSQRPSRRCGFCFLHSYEATGRYWTGLAKAGLLRPSCGVRLVHSPFGDDSRRFNAVARIGGPLHQILQERGCHFIVDRVVGGCPWHAYDFDRKLIEHYAGDARAELHGRAGP